MITVKTCQSLSILRLPSMALTTLFLLAGCASDPHEADAPKLGSGASFMQIACIDFTDTDKAKIEADLQKYQNWTQIYAVDDVTLNDAIPKDANLNSLPSQGMVCFEKPEEVD
ncbi:hypothetical protein [uncultured Shewanella sp.]|uniref:hypothetical protein n=1 Tax=uncultured Shewanella sp. TaxID=173975 RepID=UPI002603D752|nr:hypothetical protein [uncultured Shewanella sp.]